MSDPRYATERAAWRKIAPLAIIVVLVAAGSAALVLVGFGGGASRPPAVAPVVAAAATTAPAAPSSPPQAARDQPVAPPAAAAAEAKPPPEKPSFDVVRVGRGGNAVLAGRALPQAEVVISDNGAEIGRVRADSRGEFVFIPQTPLAPGGREISLASRAPDGALLQGAAPVIVIVPPQPAPGSAATQSPVPPPVVLLTPQDAAPSLLRQAGADANGGVGLDVVDYDEAGAIRFAGRAPKGATLRVYIDDQEVGAAQADAAGQWTLTPSAPVSPGDHRVRIDQLSDSGRVAARVELPFQRATLPAASVASGRVVVQPRQSLWELARHAYGQGVRYTVIYEANRDQIRDPDLIYPGQVFAIPTGAATGPTPVPASPSPASSSSAR